MSYPRLVRFAAPAQTRAEFWRTGIGLAAIAFLSWAAVFGTLGLIGAAIGPLRFAQLVTTIARAGSPEGLSMVLASFAPMALAVPFVARLWHRRSPATLFGPGALRDFLRVVGPLCILAVAVMPLSLMDENVGRATPLATVLRWLPLALPLLLVQVTAEELVFRGYLLQQIAARSPARLAWMVLPSALFGALHYAPAENGPTALWIALWATGFGCLAADLTARTGNLGAAIAFHFANNFSAMILVGLYGQLDGLSLYTIVINARDPAAVAPYLAIDSLSMLISWLLARLLLRL